MLHNPGYFNEVQAKLQQMTQEAQEATDTQVSDIWLVFYDEEGPIGGSSEAANIFYSQLVAAPSKKDAIAKAVADSRSSFYQTPPDYLSAEPMTLI